MKLLRHLFPRLAAAVLAIAAPLHAQTIAVDTGTYAPAWPAGQRNVPFVFNKDTGALITATSGAATAANQISGGPQTGSGAVTATTQRVTLASDGPGVSSLTSIDGKLGTLTPAGRSRVETLSLAGVARQLTATAASSNTALTTTTRRVTFSARNANIRFVIGSTSQTASATSHYIAQGERLDFAVPPTPNIAVIRADSTDGVLELTELVEP